MSSDVLTIPILHFNDVYNMTQSRAKPGGDRVVDQKGDLHDSIDHVVRFAQKVQEIQDGWAKDKKRCLLLFSGDLFSPSVESLLTEGRNMVHLMNELAPDACVPGNHEFDYERSQFDQLIKFSNFPWILSNAQDKTGTGGDTLKGLVKYIVQEVVIDQQTLQIGIIGLMSPDTVSKISGKASKTFKLLDMKDECMKLSKELRENQKCDLVFALTHSLYEEDFKFGKEVNCYAVGDFKGTLEDEHGVDLILGGHNHEYFVGKGISKESVVDPVDVNFKGPLPDDDGLLIIKSGTDFQDLSEVTIEVENKQDGQVRKKVVKSVKVVRHHRPRASDPAIDAQSLHQSRMSKILKRILKREVESNMKKPVGRLPEGVSGDVLRNLDQASRRRETVLGNWIADSMIKWYDIYSTSSMPKLDRPVFIMTGGSIRSGSDEIEPGKITKGDIVQLLPFNTPLVTLKMLGKDLRSVFECAFREGNKKSGSFPVVSGVKVEWNSTKPLNERVKSVKLKSKNQATGAIQEDEEIKDDQEYDILTHTYLYEAGDGLKPFEEYSKSEKGYVTDVPIYEALLRVINAISVVDASKILESTGDNSSILDSLMARFEPYLDDMDETAASEKVFDIIAEFAKNVKLPELDIPREVDGRIIDNPNS
ncbi:Trifunctional nucleotide phosphoesterase protein YfkN OS=Bacillus subtilis (strain 168) GN=yfkN PE=1 SV=1 [Rhizoctonia solani AG-1 IB]|uniref:Trifunctional nucleotide phosphoesterase protein YfkN n=1 Tax=Thanatephorus cucumeris (strain AG1-IB / isolate 7/3/14) TaxID=1108050 RepID=A0A0B7FQ32_THACB|nr:Trifunctional nucleotide phosphoesterase protein YfkN OS=Bacillus subtilis (strain 168) GN=yfkN PE=1 SV=1 [Rhizoctonia solani AG-1 IB]